MADTINGEISDQASDQASNDLRQRWEAVLEVVEVVLLAVVAVLTAWSGFQASRWEGRQSVLYGQATSYRFQADANSTKAGQELSVDAALFTAWLQAHAAQNTGLESQYERRFTPDFATAFRAWLETEPFANPQAPPGPAAMPQYQNPYQLKAASLNNQAFATFNLGTKARDTSDKYVRDTVLLATVLFFVAVAQRLHVRSARLGLALVAVGVLIYSLTEVLSLPRV